MLNLGHAHPDFTYPNDLTQVRWTLSLLVVAAIISCLLIVQAVFAM